MKFSKKNMLGILGRGVKFETGQVSVSIVGCVSSEDAPVVRVDLRGDSIPNWSDIIIRGVKRIDDGTDLYKWVTRVVPQVVNFAMKSGGHDFRLESEEIERAIDEDHR